MPYITLVAKRIILDGGKPQYAGELNFAITNYLVNECENVEYDPAAAWVCKMVNDYVDDTWGGVSYAAINDVIGVLHCAAYEALRRDASEWISDLLFSVAYDWYMHHAGPYEDAAIKRNGDVYP